MTLIDPLNISSEHSKKLAQFFNTQASNIGVWKEGQPYTFEDGTQFQFTSDVVRRHRKEGKSGYRYEFISDRLLGKGNFGEVYEIEGTLVVDSDEVQFKPHGLNGKTRAVKIQKHHAENPIDAVFKEYNLSKEASHLGVKLPTTAEGTTSYTVMKKLKGKELFDIISDDLSGISPLTLEQRVKLTQLLLKALKEQITDNGIIHRDIKGENILVDLESKSMQVNFLDFGLSVKANALDGKCCGTPAYASPEMFLNGKQTTKADVFSLGRVLALIWHVNPGSYKFSSLHDYRNNAMHVNLDSLFLGLNDLDSHNQQIIRSMLEGMVCADIDSRFTIERAIALFAQVNLGNQITNSKQSAGKKPIAAAFDLPPNSNTKALLDEEPVFIQKNLIKIREQVEQLSLPKNQSDLNLEQKQKINGLVQNLNSKIDMLSESVSQKMMRDFSKQVREAQQLIRENKGTFEHHKAGYILANIGLGLLTIGLAHLALAVYSLATSKNAFGFFSEIKTTKNSALFDEIDESFENLNKNEP
ncbi:MAG: protein kinase [Legionella sp.]|uniref:protein kinase domain-containing protein n=1 Tax=Legionella sp. TaxID=459 RepID=UPI00284EE3FC|nr:protein kinase [Legionella sp.]